MAGRGRHCSACGGTRRHRLASFPVGTCAECHAPVCARHLRFVADHGSLCPACLAKLPEPDQAAALRTVL